MTVFPGPRGGQTKSGSGNQRRHTRGWKQGDPQHKVVGKTVLGAAITVDRGVCPCR